MLNGTVHEEVISQQAPQQQQQQPPALPPAQQHQYIAEPTAQSQFVQEAELNGSSEQQPQATENEPQAPTEERSEQPETENFTPSAPEAEPEHPVVNTTVNSSGPKTYATLVKSFPSSTGATSPQAPKLSLSPVSVPRLHVTLGFPMNGKVRANLVFLFSYSHP